MKFHRARPTHRRRNVNWPRRPRWFAGYITVGTVTEILKRLYVDKDTPEMAAPWWALLARERHWMSGAAFRRVPLVPTGRTLRGLVSMLNEPSPFFALIKRDTTFTDSETA